MDRRGFLGILAALPLVKSIVPKEEQKVTAEEINRVLNTSISDPIWSTIPCSGYIDLATVPFVAGSGTFRIER